MAETKRRFYNTDDAKGFTKKMFFETVLAMAQGEDMTDVQIDLLARAAEYELEGIANKPSKAGTGEKKDALQSDYAAALRTAILPLITAEAKSAKELVDAATAKGHVSESSGKPFSAPWVSRVLNKEPGITAIKKIVETTDAKGLKSQKEVTAYKR